MNSITSSHLKDVFYCIVGLALAYLFHRIIQCCRNGESKPRMKDAVVGEDCANETSLSINKIMLDQRQVKVDSDKEDIIEIVYATHLPEVSEDFSNQPVINKRFDYTLSEFLDIASQGELFKSEHKNSDIYIDATVTVEEDEDDPDYFPSDYSKEELLVLKLVKQIKRTAMDREILNCIKEIKISRCCFFNELQDYKKSGGNRLLDLVQELGLSIEFPSPQDEHNRIAAKQAYEERADMLVRTGYEWTG